MSLPKVVYGDFNALPKKVQEFVRENAILCQPDQIHICDGSEKENKMNIDYLINKGTAQPLSKHDNCYAVFTDPRDVARVEARTFICTKNKHDAVPHFTGEVGRLGRWLSEDEANKKLAALYPGCMKGRTMFVIPFSMGVVGSAVAKIGIELTDWQYVVCCMRIMTRMGSKVLEALGDGDFVKGLHSVGCPVKEGKEDPKWPCNPEKTIITHFPERREIKSFGSGYGGNSLLGKKCFALRIASNIARDEGWLAEHMMILGLTNPEGKKIYVAAAFPSACGKTNLAMITPTLPGWKAECIGDDIAWMWFDQEGVLRAINPESGFFGVAPGTCRASNPIAMKTFQKDCVFTNVAVTSDGDFWWEGLDPPKEGTAIKSWLGVENWEEGQGKAAHPNSRFCAPSDHCPIMDKDWENPKGVPISAILFGGRRPHGVPLIFESFNWQHGVFVASALSSEATAAAEFKGKTIMRDPFAMRPFFGYNFGKYLEHWLSMDKVPGRKLPKIFHVNWFRVDDHGHFLWPGFGENSRVLEYVFRRVHGEEITQPSAVGMLPRLNAINLDGLKPKPDIAHCLLVRKNYWLEEVDNLRLYFEKEVGEDLPQVIKDELNALEERVKAMPDQAEGEFHTHYYEQAIQLHAGEMPPVVHGDFSKLAPKVQEFVRANALLCQPDKIHICDGSAEENQACIDVLVKRGVCKKLAHEKHENCYCVFTDSRDVARVEARTFMCTEKKHDSVPHFKGQVGRLARWKDPTEVNKMLMEEYYPGCMRGRTMFVIPFSMGPIGSPVSKIGIELTDSEYVYCCMRIMTRVGTKVLNVLGDGDFVKGLHSVGYPLKWGEVGPKWPCNPEKTIITHFPATREIKSFGSGYGGNSLLGKKCFALRIACNIAREEGWLAEHMMILGLTNPEGKKIYVAAAFPSACGKTNLAMITPTLPGWKAECIGDDIAWMWFDKDGVLRAINPESGFFGVAPGTSFHSNPMAMKTFQKDTIFTNVAMTSDGDYWWEGLPPPPEGVTITSWLGVENWEDGQGKAAHPNSRFCAPSDHCPMMDKDWENPKGVPISAILFGGRRPHGVPLIYESFNWQHGVFVASALSSEATAAAEFKGKVIMRDPFAMRPFFGYNFGRYLEHWLGMEKPANYKLPKIYHVNWFRIDQDGHFLWPGFGENSRVLEWVFRRCQGEDIAERSAVGYLPKPGTINLSGLDPQPDMDHLMLIRKKYWLEECKNLRQYYNDEVGEDLPQVIWDELDALEKRLTDLPDQAVPLSPS